MAWVPFPILTHCDLVGLKVDSVLISYRIVFESFCVDFFCVSSNYAIFDTHKSNYGYAIVLFCATHIRWQSHTPSQYRKPHACVCVCHTVWYQYALAQMTRCEFTYQLSVAQHNKKNIQSQIEFVLCCVCRVGILHLSGLFDGVWCRIPQRTKKRKDEKKTKLFYKHTQPIKKLIAAAAAVSSSVQVWFAKNTEANFATENRTHNLWLVLNLKNEEKTKIASRDWLQNDKQFLDEIWFVQIV